ncbi:MAG TPA: sigma-70 family RNA polymerase sigma factor [Candidatus Deferrimicrobium sp.]
MKRASAESASLGNDSGLATRLAEHIGPRPEDAALLSKLRLDAPAAIETLFDRYHEKVYGLAMSILMNKREAEEATQDVFLAVVRKAECFQEDSGNHSWIYRICVNTCLMRLRKDRRRETVPIEEFLPAFTKEGAYASPVEDWSLEVERQIPEKEIGQVIGGFAGELTEKYRLVFAFCDLQGFSYEETAQILGMPIAVVKSRLHLARLYLRERLSRYHGDGRVV